MRLIHPIIRISVLLLCGVMASSIVSAAETKRVGILSDGPYYENEKFVSHVQTELSRLIEDKMEVEYPPESILDGGYNKADIERYAWELAHNHDLDVILSLGSHSAVAFTNMDPLPVPVVSMSVDFPIALGLMDEETLKPANPNWLTSYDPSVGTTIQSLLAKLTPAKEVTIICPSLLCDTYPQIKQELIRIGQRGGIAIRLHSISPENYKSKLATLDVPLVYVLSLRGFTDDQIEDVFNQLADQNIPAYTEDGIYGIEKGALVSIDIYNFEKLGRNFALKVYDLFNGVPTEKILLKDYWKTDLIFNLDTARKIHFGIPLEFVDEARLYGSREEKKVLPFETALNTALNQNYNIKIQALIQNQAAYDVEITEREFYPQLFSDLNYNKTDNRRADVNLGSPRGETKVELSLEQKLFDRELWKTIESLEYESDIQEKTLELVNQDILLETSQTYMDNLSQEEIRVIRREFLNIVRKNQAIADLRFKLGDTDRSDVIRLDIELENARIALVDVQDRLFRARVRLNNLLNLPEEAGHDFDYTSFNEESYNQRKLRFEKYLMTAKGLKILRDFFTEEAYSRSMELKTIEASIRKTEAEKDAVKSKFLPTIGAEVSYFNQVQEDSRGLTNAEQSAYNDLFNEGWSARLNLRFPIFTGGSRFKELNKANVRIQEFTTRKDNLKDDISERARTSLFNIYRSRVNTDRAILAARLSEENLALQEVAYREGDIPIIDLLDAQTNLINSQIDSIQARYDFYKTLFGLFRILGRNDLTLDFLNQEKLKTFRNQLDSYFTGRMRESMGLEPMKEEETEEKMAVDQPEAGLPVEDSKSPSSPTGEATEPSPTTTEHNESKEGAAP